jgi:hypothetical protein
LNFAGIPLATLLPIGAAVFGAVTVLYILKLRRRPVAVPYSPIWQRVLRDKDATTWFSQLKRLLSLLLQLLLVTLLLVALGDPRLSANTVDGRNVIVLIDASASMKATDVAPSRLERARQDVRSMVRGLGGADRILIAQMDASLTPLSTLTGDVSELERGLGQLRATDTRADLGRALAFAVDSLRGLSKPEIVIVSDGVLGDLDAARRGLPLDGVGLRWVKIGSGSRNVGLTEFSVRRYPLDKSRAEVMLEVQNVAAETAEVELGLYGDDQLVDVTTLRLGPNEKLPRFYQDLAGANRTLEARLRLVNGKDELPADDRAYALVPERRRARVCVVTPGNTYLEAALLLDEYLDVTTVEPARYPPSGRFDVTLFDGVAPPLAKDGGGAIYLAPPADGAPVKRGKALKDFGFDVWDKKSPLLRFMALGDVQVAQGFALKPEKGDTVVGASDGGPLLVAGRRDGRRFVALGFDARDSDFVLRPAWPLFVLNTIDSFVEDDSTYLSSYATGSAWRLPAPSGASGGTLSLPDGTRREVPVKQGRAIFFGEQAGFYELSIPSEPEPIVTRFAANLVAPEESRIEPPEKLELGRPLEGPPEFRAGVRRELWLYLLIAALLLSLAEWLTYHRRVTV